MCPWMKKSINQHPDSPKPQRTCVACRRVAIKGELVRLCRTADGSVEIDPGGKGSGRGAYLCRTRECWETGLKSGRLEHSLKTTLGKPQREELIRIAEEKLFSPTG